MTTSIVTPQPPAASENAIHPGLTSASHPHLSPAHLQQGSHVTPSLHSPCCCTETDNADRVDQVSDERLGDLLDVIGPVR
ncbi:hypothetical protein Pcinc_022261 [Petrolisthes cinctipes]|uniref:Uncharacterized protein n=1 Tax=Petrolisthes cinctipes TaxID=88211 RepID=A0AAE1FFZ0_PETCI|nr:hypothetical protein Pcinc_022261 [Petrolisthes cinctipes]